jgi:xanthine dehydrogenase large subunit
VGRRYYRTPKIHWDRKTLTGRPFFYFAYGAAVSEVALDTLTGEFRLLRVDILHDVGTSLNPAVDLGQVEGGFLQGAGWLTSEELWWDARGQLGTHAPSTYKIPAASDWPADTRVVLLERAPNVEDTIFRSRRWASRRSCWPSLYSMPSAMRAPVAASRARGRHWLRLRRPSPS